MRGQRQLVFATKSDWVPVLADLENSLPIRYFKSGLFDEPDPVTFKSYTTLPHFGIASRGDAVQEDMYLVQLGDSPSYVRAVPQRLGGIKYAIDHENNPDSVIFQPGGLYIDSRALIEGGISKISRSRSAENIYSALSRLIQTTFTTAKSYRIGSEARSLYEAGWRLTSSVLGNPEYDLALD